MAHGHLHSYTSPSVFPLMDDCFPLWLSQRTHFSSEVAVWWARWLFWLERAPKPSWNQTVSAKNRFNCIWQQVKGQFHTSNLSALSFVLGRCILNCSVYSIQNLFPGHTFRSSDSPLSGSPLVSFHQSPFYKLSALHFCILMLKSLS